MYVAIYGTAQMQLDSRDQLFDNQMYFNTSALTSNIAKQNSLAYRATNKIF